MVRGLVVLLDQEVPQMHTQEEVVLGEMMEMLEAVESMLAGADYMVGVAVLQIIVPMKLEMVEVVP
jgi:hypothetical protein